MKFISTLSKIDKKEKNIKYTIEDNKINGVWGNTQYSLDNYIVNDILKYFFIDKEKWYELGASMTEPKKDGLGRFIVDKEYRQTNGNKLKSRDASFIAAILYDMKKIDYERKKSIKIRKI